MILPDVNVLVYAHRRSAREHEACRAWIDGLVNGEEAYAVSDIVLSGFVRIVTHRRIFDPPSTVDQALEFADLLRDQPHCMLIQPGARHWGIFNRLCRDSKVHGNLVPDAFLAALAIEHGCELVSTDSDFARFKGLRWRHPLS